MRSMSETRGTQVAAWSWRQELWRSGRGRISFQVLQECYVQLLRIWPDRRTEAQAEVRDLLAWKPVAVDLAILELSWELRAAAPLPTLVLGRADCVSSESDGSGYLLTEDLQAGQELDGVKVLNPFLTEPASLGGW
jgi:predicted nucleic acid-binding protein